MRSARTHEFKFALVYFTKKWITFLTLVCTSHAVERPRRDGHDPFALQSSDLSRPAHVVVGAVAQPVVVALAPGEHGAASGEGDGELGAALNLDGA